MSGCNARALQSGLRLACRDSVERLDVRPICAAQDRLRGDASWFGLTAQAAVRCISKVADAYKLDRETQRHFRPDAAQPYDDRIIRFVKDGSAVSLWTIEGRIVVPIVMGEHQRRLMAYRKGEVDLCFIRGKWILSATCDIPETEEFEADDWIGVDLGIVSLAVDSDGRVHTGADVERKRRQIQKRRNGLQKRGTKAAKHRLCRLAGKQARYQKHVNHCIAKAVVMDAERTGRGIALEQLKGIRTRVTARSNQRARLGNWGFAKLGGFIGYKARLAGVPVVYVDPRNTSRQCRECGCIDKKTEPIKPPSPVFHAGMKRPLISTRLGTFEPRFL